MSPESPSANLRYAGTFLPTQFIRLVHQHVRANGNVFCVRSAVCQPEHRIALLEATLALAGQLFDGPAELDAQGFRCLWWYWIHAFSLQQVHSVQAECLHLD